MLLMVLSRTGSALINKGPKGPRCRCTSLWRSSSVLDDENYIMRLMVDQSVVEAFGQGRRTCITSRVYTTEAMNGDAWLFLFNNTSDLNVTASVKVLEMNNAELHPMWDRW